MDVLCRTNSFMAKTSVDVFILRRKKRKKKWPRSLVYGDPVQNEQGGQYGNFQPGMLCRLIFSHLFSLKGV